MDHHMILMLYWDLTKLTEVCIIVFVFTTECHLICTNPRNINVLPVFRWLNCGACILISWRM